MSQPVELPPVLPVVTIARAADAVPVAEALLEGGLDAIEIASRTPAALAAIEAIAASFPEVRLGAGCVLRPADVAAARSAGARFLVSPGLTADLAAAGLASGLPFIPGVMTASEVLVAWELGFSLLKLHPVAELGGAAYLELLGRSFREIRFYAASGFAETDAAAYLALDNVPLVGAGWVAPTAAIEARDWPAITAAARRARRLGQRGRVSL
jgi:2-dehydro-3-deoxyphosphogluconate aldolase/(4S)-4-hydroxy-2-oxoglutarate aldolase